jgi:hypothetical protein
LFQNRFTDAYDAAMECMPRASTPQEECCVAQNAYIMGTELVRRAKNQRYLVCAEWQVEMSDGNIYRTTERKIRDSILIERVDCTGGWVWEGEDYTADELLPFATGYCTAECR